MPAHTNFHNSFFHANSLFIRDAKAMQHLSHSLWQVTGAQFVFKTLRQTAEAFTHKDVGWGCFNEKERPARVCD